MTKKTAKEIKVQADQNQEVVNPGSPAGQLFSFSLKEEEIEEKIAGKGALPFISGLTGAISGRPGETVFVQPTLVNPDPAEDYGGLFLSLFFGAANALNNDGYLQALAEGNFHHNADWPYMSSERLSLAPGEIVSHSMSYQIPTGILPNVYHGNLAFWRINPIGQGTLLGRASFYLEVA